jgi:hypothetical protein
MKVSKLQPGDLVLAWDRRALCTRLIQAIQTDLVDEFGQVLKDYEEVDTERGELTRRLANGRREIVRGIFYVVVKDSVAKQKEFN